MIQTNELRIGSYLKYKNTNDLAIVDLIHRNNFDCKDEYGSFTPNGNYEPIPLTEEWLLKFGFELKNNNNYFNEIKYGIWHNKQKTEPYEIGFYCAISDVKLDYVHELQNLYFALTGNELTINK